MNSTHDIDFLCAAIDEADEEQLFQMAAAIREARSTRFNDDEDTDDLEEIY